MRCFLPAILLFSFASFAGDWPQWRGPDRDGFAAPDEKISVEAITEPKRLWHIPIGGGFSSPIVWKNRVIYLDEHGGKEVAHMLDGQTAREIWELPYADI